MLIDGFISCFRLLSAKQRKEYFIVLFLSTISSLTDMLGIASIIPVISALVNYENSVNSGYLFSFYELVGRPEKDQFLTIIVLGAVALVWFSGLSTMLSLFANQRFFKRVNADISSRVYLSYMNQPIEQFYARPSSEFLRDVNGISERVSMGVFGASVTIVSRAIQVSFIVILLLIVNVFVTSIIVSILLVAYLGIYWGIKRKIAKIASENFDDIKTIQQIAIGSYQGYRSIKVDQQIEHFVSRFSSLKRKAAKKVANIGIIGAIPKNLIEVTGITTLIVASYYIGTISEDSNKFVSVMGLFGVAAYKVLPSAQQLYHAFNRITTALSVYFKVEKVWNGLQPKITMDKKNLRFEECNEIKVVNLCYSYDGKVIFNNFSTTIVLSGVIRVSGPSGIGKSTFVELLVGLRHPENGTILLDGLCLSEIDLDQWWRQISYISQGDYLFSGTLGDNIAIGETSIDWERMAIVEDICGLTTLSDDENFSMTLPIQEGGINLSGGQRSRVLIARALYKQSKVVFLDEAFSALDIEAARKIIERMEAEFPTRCFVIISHRENELRRNVATVELGGAG